MRIRMAPPTDVDAVFSLATEFATSFEVDKRPFLESFYQVMSDAMTPSSPMAESHGLKR